MQPDLTGGAGCAPAASPASRSPITTVLADEVGTPQASLTGGADYTLAAWHAHDARPRP
jgi:hypothetical protein